MDYKPIDDYVLYVEDDPDDREFLTMSFANVNPSKKVRTLADDKALFDFLHSLKQGDELPCLIILDYDLPVNNGQDILIRLKKEPRFENIPVVMFVASDFMLNKKLLRSLNTGYVMKPSHLDLWERIAVDLLDHCEVAKRLDQERSGR
jgi:CheY-like chemotaxis protein